MRRLSRPLLAVLEAIAFPDIGFFDPPFPADEEAEGLVVAAAAVLGELRESCRHVLGHRVVQAPVFIVAGRYRVPLAVEASHQFACPQHCSRPGGYCDPRR